MFPLPFLSPPCAVARSFHRLHIRYTTRHSSRCISVILACINPHRLACISLSPTITRVCTNNHLVVCALYRSCGYTLSSQFQIPSIKPTTTHLQQLGVRLKPTSASSAPAYRSYGHWLRNGSLGHLHRDTAVNPPDHRMPRMEAGVEVRRRVPKKVLL